MLSDYLPTEYMPHNDARLCRVIEQIIEIKNPFKVPRQLITTSRRFHHPTRSLEITRWIASGFNCVK